MSYRKKHIKNKLHNIKPKHSIFRKLWFWISVLVFIFISFCLYFLFLNSYFQVKDISVVGNKSIETKNIQDLILNNSKVTIFSAGPVKIYSGSIFLVSGKKISADILKQFPEIEKVTITKKIPRALNAQIVERKALGVFCQTTSYNLCFSIDNNGVIFGESMAAPEGTSIVRQASLDSEVFSGDAVVAKEAIHAIYAIQQNLKDTFQIELKEAIISSPRRLNIITDENWQIYFDLSDGADVGPQVEKLDYILNGGITEEQRNNLRYINLIPEDKAEICDNAVCGR